MNISESRTSCRRCNQSWENECSLGQIYFIAVPETYIRVDGFHEIEETTFFSCVWHGIALFEALVPQYFHRAVWRRISKTKNLWFPDRARKEMIFTWIKPHSLLEMYCFILFWFLNSLDPRFRSFRWAQCVKSHWWSLHSILYSLLPVRNLWWLLYHSVRKFIISYKAIPASSSPHQYSSFTIIPPIWNPWFNKSLHRFIKTQKSFKADFRLLIMFNVAVQLSL